MIVVVLYIAAADDDGGRFPQKALINSQIRGIFALAHTQKYD